MAAIQITDEQVDALRAFLRPATARNDEEFADSEAASEPVVKEEGQALLYLAAFDEALQQRFASSTDLGGDIVRFVADFRSVHEPFGWFRIDPRMAEAMIRGRFGLEPEPILDPDDVLNTQIVMLQMLVMDLRRLRGFDASVLEGFVTRSTERAAGLAVAVTQLLDGPGADAALARRLRDRLADQHARGGAGPDQGSNATGPM
jgi:hypothetical protein